MRLHVLDAREMGHVGRAGAAEHLVGHTVDASLPTRFFEDAEKKIVRLDGRPPRSWEDERLGAGVPADRPPPFKLSLDRNGKPYIRIAAFGLSVPLPKV
jgi:hypothetical protein